MAASHEVLVVEAEERVGGGQELGMEDDLDPVGAGVEELAASEGAHDGVGGVVDDVVRRDGRKQRRSLSEDATLQPDDVVLGQEVMGVRHVASETSLVHPFPDVLLDFVDGVFQALGDGVAAQRLDVEAVRGRRENEEGHHLEKKRFDLRLDKSLTTLK